MKKTFYHPHTILDSISDLDERWLAKQLDEKPFDIHFQYLNMLKNIDKDFESGVYRSIQNLRQLDPNIRIGHILQRISKEKELQLNAVSTVSIKSKKSDSIADTSIILAGLIDIEDHSDEFDINTFEDTEPAEVAKEEESIVMEETGSKPDYDATANTDTEGMATESILHIESIEIEDEDSIEANPKEDNAMPEVAAIAAGTVLAIDTIDSDEEDLEEIELEKIEETSDDITIVEKEIEEQQVAIESHGSSISESSSANFTDWLNSLPNFHSNGSTQVAAPTVISEPLAQLLVKQGHKADAISMYKQLMQKFPEKSSFFADQIENLK